MCLTRLVPYFEESLFRTHLLHIYGCGSACAETHVGDPPVHAKDTIGEFYNEVKLCIEQLYKEGLEVFDSDLSEQQVQWPWNSSYVSELVVVDSPDTAETAIDLITTQGEGANPINPEDSTTGILAHFFRFEEIVCQKDW